jgi:hypothetical protein
MDNSVKNHWNSTMRRRNLRKRRQEAEAMRDVGGGRSGPASAALAALASKAAPSVGTAGPRPYAKGVVPTPASPRKSAATSPRRSSAGAPSPKRARRRSSSTSSMPSNVAGSAARGGNGSATNSPARPRGAAARAASVSTVPGSPTAQARFLELREPLLLGPSSSTAAGAAAATNGHDMASETRARMQKLFARVSKAAEEPIYEDTTEGETDIETGGPLAGAALGRAPLPHMAPLSQNNTATAGVDMDVRADVRTDAAAGAGEQAARERSRTTLQKVLAHSSKHDDSGNASDASRLSPLDGSGKTPSCPSTTTAAESLLGLHHLTEAAASISRGKCRVVVVTFLLFFFFFWPSDFNFFSSHMPLCGTLPLNISLSLPRSSAVRCARDTAGPE